MRGVGHGFWSPQATITAFRQQLDLPVKTDSSGTHLSATTIEHLCDNSTEAEFDMITLRLAVIANKRQYHWVYLTAACLHRRGRLKKS
jgi:hypothetical protein